MDAMRRVLLVDDDPLFCESVNLLLREARLKVDVARTYTEGLNLLRSGREYGVMIFDFDLPGGTGDVLARKARECRPEAPILFSTGQFGSEPLRLLLESGVSCGFFAKGLSLHILKDKVLSLWERYFSKDRVVEARPTPAEVALIGEASPMQRVRQQLQRYKSLSEPVLLLGESGTGKELAAEALHKQGAPWVAVNCAKFLDQEGLLESELFGHIKGSFTGAHQDHAGLLEEADGGTLFLDEVHSLSLSSQQKLLRVLQERKYRRVGETKERALQRGFRLVAAAKDDLFERVKSGAFLPDFYFRIHTLTIELPPLRERLEDLEILCQHFLCDLTQQMNFKVGLRAQTLMLMKTYSWPGNVRELKNCLYRLAVDSSSGVIETKDFLQYLVQTGARLTGEMALAEKTNCYKDFLQDAETRYFKFILAQCSSREEILKRTGVSKSTLYRKLTELGIELTSEGTELCALSSN